MAPRNTFFELTEPQNYTQPLLEIFQTQYFDASLQAQQYASGGVNDLARAWIPVLALVFVMNIFVLIYFLFHRGLVTDFSEPPNLFALAVNSPPSHLLAGSCGGGPEGKQYRVNWFVNHEGSHLFMEPGEKSALLNHHHNDHHHQHGPVEELGPPPTQKTGGFFASMAAAIRNRLGVKPQAPRKFRTTTAVESLRAPMQSRPVSVVGSEFEMQEGQERIKRNFDRLKNRRSLL